MISRDDVVYGFRFYLNEDPENEAVIERYIERCPNFAALRTALIESPVHRRIHRWYRYPGGRYETPAFLTESSDRRIAYQGGEPSLENPVSQFCTASQFQTGVYEFWRNARNGPARMHRKDWEWNYILQALHCHAMLEPGRKGLGFAVGTEPLVATMAARGCQVVASDAPVAVVESASWVRTGQHSTTVEALNTDGICDAAAFRARASFRPVDMNDIPGDLRGFDFLWSSCAMEHLGSLEQGVRFVEQSLNCLRPGGVAVHTTEFNLSSNSLTIENKDASIYRKCDIEGLYLRLREAGHQVAPLNFCIGDRLEDRHVDLPPYFETIPTGGAEPAHLKLLWHDAELSAVLTSFGLIVKRQA